MICFHRLSIWLWLKLKNQPEKTFAKYSSKLAAFKLNMTKIQNREIDDKYFVPKEKYSENQKIFCSFSDQPHMLLLLSVILLHNK